MSSPPPAGHRVARSPARDPILRLVAIFGAGIAGAAVLGFWRSAALQCGIHPSYHQYGVCPLDSGSVVVFLLVLTGAVVALAVAAVTGEFPRLASIAGATLVVGAFLFPYSFAFADLGIGGWNPGVVLGGALALGGAGGFLEILRHQLRRGLPMERYNSLTVGGALIAFTGACAYWLPQNLSWTTSVCSSPAGGLGCLPSAAPILSEAFSLGLIVLGIGVASPVLLPRWPEVGFLCTVASAFAAFFALLNPDLFGVALSLGIGSILALVGVLPRMVRLPGSDRPPTEWPPRSARRGSS